MKASTFMALASLAFLAALAILHPVNAFSTAPVLRESRSLALRNTLSRKLVCQAQESSQLDNLKRKATATISGFLVASSILTGTVLPAGAQAPAKELTIEQRAAEAEKRAQAAAAKAKAAKAALEKELKDRAEKEKKAREEAERKLREEEKKAKEAIERESKNYQSLSEAKQQLEEKISQLKSKLTKAEGDSEMLATMKEELKKMQDALKNEQDAKKLVIRLKKEKEELKQQLEETRKSFLFQVQETVVSLGHASTEKAKEVAAQAAELAAMLKSNIGQVDQEVSHQFSKFVSSQHAKRAREATAPVLNSAHSSLSSLLGNFLSLIRFPIPHLRQVVKRSISSSGLFSQYQDEAAAASDYWMLIGPCVGANIILIFSWLNQSVRHLGFRVQLLLLLFWGFLAAISFFYDTMPTVLLANNFSAAQIALIYAIMIAHYMLVVVSYFYVVMRGPSRLLATMQCFLVCWVLISFLNLLLHPLLRRGKESCSADDFTKAHLMRAFTGMLFATFGH